MGTKQLKVWMIDPTSMVPYSNASLCRALQIAGCQVSMITAPFVYDTWSIYQGVNVEYRFSRFLENSFALKFTKNAKARRLLRLAEYPFDLLNVFGRNRNFKPILHFQWTTVPALDAGIWRVLKHENYPLIYSAHNILPHDAKKIPFGLKQLYELPHRIIVHSPELADELHSRFPKTATRIRVVPLGLFFEDVPALSSNIAREKLAMDPEKPVALFWGLIEPYKGVEHLIRAFADVVHKVPQAQLLLIGKPNVSIEPYLQLIEDLGLTKSIRTRFEYVPTEEASIYFGAADVVVLPYVEASQSGVLLAAYRFGKAVIVTDTGGLGAAVKSGKNGFVVPPGDENRLAQTLITVLSDRQNAKVMGAASKEIGLKSHNWSNIAKQMIAIYQEVVNEMN